MNPTVSETSKLAAIRKTDLADERIERDEQRVRCDRLVAGQRVEQRGLAGVRVTDQRHGGHRGLVPTLAQLRSTPANAESMSLARMLIAVTDAPAVRFQLGFARASRADAAAQPRERGVRTDQARHQVLQLRELDLQLALHASARGARRCRESTACDRPLCESRAFSRLRSCAGDSSLSKITTSARDLVARRRERFDLAAAEERRRIRLRRDPAAHAARPAHPPQPQDRRARRANVPDRIVGKGR